MAALYAMLMRAWQHPPISSQGLFRKHTHQVQTSPVLQAILVNIAHNIAHNLHRSVNLPPPQVHDVAAKLDAGVPSLFEFSRPGQAAPPMVAYAPALRFDGLSQRDLREAVVGLAAVSMLHP